MYILLLLLGGYYVNILCETKFGAPQIAQR